MKGVVLAAGNGSFGSFMSRVSTITQEIVNENDSDFNVGFIPYVVDGELYLCAYSIIGGSETSPGVGRTDGPAECNSYGPNMGHEQFD